MAFPSNMLTIVNTYIFDWVETIPFSQCFYQEKWCKMWKNCTVENVMKIWGFMPPTTSWGLMGIELNVIDLATRMWYGDDSPDLHK